MTSNDDDNNLAPQQTKKIVLALLDFQWWQYQPCPTAILKKLPWHHIFSNDDDTRVATQQF